MRRKIAGRPVRPEPQQVKLLCPTCHQWHHEDRATHADYLDLSECIDCVRKDSERLRAGRASRVITL